MYPDLKTVAQVYVRFLLARILYRLFASAIEHLGLDEAFLVGDALEWSSPFSDIVNALSCREYASLSSQMVLPGYVWDILQPPDANRVRIFDPSLARPATFVVSIVKSIRNTHNGMKLKDRHQLTTHHTCVSFSLNGRHQIAPCLSYSPQPPHNSLSD